TGAAGAAGRPDDGDTGTGIALRPLRPRFPLGAFWSFGPALASGPGRPLGAFGALGSGGAALTCGALRAFGAGRPLLPHDVRELPGGDDPVRAERSNPARDASRRGGDRANVRGVEHHYPGLPVHRRSEEHTTELQSRENI